MAFSDPIGHDAVSAKIKLGKGIVVDDGVRFSINFPSVFTTLELGAIANESVFIARISRGHVFQLHLLKLVAVYFTIVLVAARTHIEVAEHAVVYRGSSI